jgi:hypothetical protein
MYSIINYFLILYKILNASIYESMRRVSLKLFKFQCLWSHAQIVSPSKYNFLLFHFNSLATSSKLLMWYVLNEYVNMDWD